MIEFRLPFLSRGFGFAGAARRALLVASVLALAMPASADAGAAAAPSSCPGDSARRPWT